MILSFLRRLVVSFQNWAESSLIFCDSLFIILTDRPDIVSAEINFLSVEFYSASAFFILKIFTRLNFFVPTLTLKRT